MRFQMPVALLAIIFGPIEIAGGTQELFYLGILHSQTEPLIIGALGTVGGAFLLWARITLLVHPPLSATVVPAAAYVSIPVSVICGVIKHYAAWPITTVGILYPLFMFVYYRRTGTQATSKS
jgi:hypothetical protein